MALRPTKPQKGDKVLQSLYNTVCDIVDYLPSLEVRGDNKTISVSHSTVGTTIHAVQPYSIVQGGKGKEYYGASGVALVSGNTFVSALSGDGTTVVINNNIISAIGGGGPSGPDNDTTYIGDKNTIPSAHIWVDQSGTSPRLISSDLVYIDNLQNYKFVESSNILMPNSLTACNNTVDISQVGTVYSNHFIQTRDILHDGVGTKVNLCWQNNPFGTPQPGKTAGIIEGLQVDLTLSGGRFADVVLHKHVYGAYDPNTGTRYDPPTESRVDCLLSGDNQHIFISQQQPNENGSWGGIISTNIHGDETTIHMAADGTLSAIGGGGGGGGFNAPNYDNIAEQCSTLIYPLMRYTTSTGGWLRISLKSGTSRCVGYWVNNNYIGLGTGIMTWIQPIPAGVSFYVDVDYNVNNLVWFDSTVTPSKVTRDEWNYWLMPPQWDENQYYISEVKNYFNNARSAENSCRNLMIGAEGNLNSMINDWTKYEHLVQSDPSVQPQSLDWYSEVLGYINDKFNDCSGSFDSAVYYIGEAQTLYETLPSTNAMYDYQFADIPVKCQQYCDQIQQYITSGQYYYGLAETYWNSQQ